MTCYAAALTVYLCSKEHFLNDWVAWQEQSFIVLITCCTISYSALRGNSWISCFLSHLYTFSADFLSSPELLLADFKSICWVTKSTPTNNFPTSSQRCNDVDPRPFHLLLQRPDLKVNRLASLPCWVRPNLLNVFLYVGVLVAWFSALLFYLL